MRKGIPLYVATKLSSTKKSSAILLKALVALFPGSTGVDAWPSNVINSPRVAPSGGERGSTCFRGSDESKDM